MEVGADLTDLYSLVEQWFEIARNVSQWVVVLIYASIWNFIVSMWFGADPVVFTSYGECVLNVFKYAVVVMQPVRSVLISHKPEVICFLSRLCLLSNLCFLCLEQW
ncbi:hypothetical protein HYC85_008664 [Camellia sinensis]|uniref:Uncharacterized protein n=1 Tax=Camellia sinensis TaxID=4442 RepID=A0A7J7HV15_CAMSI|nr:hypothetical protein HYC85_008664 [Camellia sinensis]